MKKYFIILALLLSVTACAQSDGQVSAFSLTQDQEDNYKALIAATLNSNNWSFNPDTVVFASDKLPDKDDDLYDRIESISSSAALELPSHAGLEAVKASVPLQHINGDNLGTAYFFFDKDTTVCEYYIYKDNYYNIKSKTPFELNDVLKKFEDTEKYADFEKTSAKAKFDNVYAANNGIAASIKDNDTVIYYDTADNFKAVSKVDYTGKGFVPMDITLGDEFGTVLLGKKVDVTQNEDENEVSDTVTEPPARSAVLALTDGRGKLTGVEIPTTVSSFTSVAQYGSKLFFARDKSIDEFTYDGTSLVKAKTYVLDNYVSRIRLADIDGDGTTEFIVSDGTNIYVYEKTSTFNMIWRSNSYLSSITGCIYTGDLNGDGVKELYIKDSIGVTARYVLTPQGFRIHSGSLMTGSDDNYIIADFNADGKDDYMTMPPDGQVCTLFTAK